MTSLAPSPVMVSLVQAASMLPVFLFALPGGALADILDRRLTLIGAQLWIAAAGLVLAVLAALGLLGARGLLAAWCMDRRCGRMTPYPDLGSCDADVLRAPELEHAV
jgi:MFS family permease